VAVGRLCAEAGASNTTMASAMAVRRMVFLMVRISWREERNRATE
jgi:hypothetical protein